MNETNQMTAPSSVEYYLGDLAYVLDDTSWREVCNITVYDNSEREYELEDGRKFILFSTAYGDGVYLDGQGNRYSVDSGTIGAIKIQDLNSKKLNSAIQRGLGQIHTFPAEIDGSDCFYDEGVIGIYNVEIDTAGSDGEEEEDAE